MLAVAVVAACASGTDPDEFLGNGTPATPTPGGENVSGAAQIPAAVEFAYTGAGEESIDKPTQASHAQGPEIAASVFHDGDVCWGWRAVLNSDHLMQRSFCRSADGAITSSASANELTWNVGPIEVTNQTEVFCDPSVVIFEPGMEPGEIRTTSCVGETSEAGSYAESARVTFIGRETLTIGSGSIDAAHVREESQLTGDTTGTSTTDWWFETETGLVVRIMRTVNTVSSSIVGDVNYKEQGDFALAQIPTES